MGPGVRYFLVFVAAVFAAITVETHLRRSRDWSQVVVDDLGWQVLEGLYRSRENAQEMRPVMKHLLDSGAFIGKQVLVTGGNRGLGREMAIQLAALGADVTVTSRRPDDEVLSEMNRAIQKERYRVTTLPGTINMVALDLADASTFPATIATLRKAVPDGFHVVILNAGMAPSGSGTTKQGFEEALGVNCIGHHFFTKLLLGARLVTERIIVISSSTSRIVEPLNITTILDVPTYCYSEGMKYYGRSKLCVDTLSYRLAQTLKTRDISVHINDPGPVATDIARGAPAFIRPLVNGFMQSLFQTSRNGARPAIMLAGMPEFKETTGRFFHLHMEKALRADATDAAKASALENKIINAIVKSFQEQQ